MFIINSHSTLVLIKLNSIHTMNRLLSFLFLALACSLNAQTITVSEDLPLRSDVTYELIGELKGQLLLFRDKNNSFEVQAFDETMRKSWNKEIELDKRLPNVLGIIHTPSDFTVFYRFRDKSHTVLKAHKYNAGANMIDSITVKNYGYLFYTPNFRIIQSEDKSKVLLYYIEKHKIINALVFDAIDMRVLWEQAITPEELNYWEDYFQIMLDNDGNFRMVIEKDNYIGRRDEHRYHVYEFYGAENRLNEYKLFLDGNLTYDVFFTYDNMNQKLVGAGFYSERNNGKASGYFFMQVPPEAPDNRRITFTPFEDNFVSSLEGREIDNNRGITEVAVRDIILRHDGGALIVAERIRQYERRTGTTYSRVYYDPTGRSMVDYYFDEVIVFSVEPDGQPGWTNVLHKKQYSQDDDGMYSSYFLFKTTTTLRFLFNDEIKPENTVSEYIMNGYGDLERKSLLSTENLELRLRFRDALQTAANELVVPSEKRNKLRLIRLEY